MTERLHAALQAARHDGALSVYLPAGHPAPGEDMPFFEAAIRGGAAWIELGIPFSDPAADGPVIQAATADALAKGQRVHHAFSTAQHLRQAFPHVPIIAMTYANVAYRMEWDRFAQALAEAGIDGLILPDVPVEESGPVREALHRHDVAWVPLVTPTTSLERMKKIGDTATGFLYVVGNVGITGQADPGPLVEATVQRARQATDAPLVVGFGIASPEAVQRVHEAGADGAIVGSHIVAQIRSGASPGDIEAEVARLAAPLRRHEAT